MKKLLLTYATFVFLLTLVVGVTFAAFSDTAKILGASFSVGSADIKLLVDVAGGTNTENLADDLGGPTFTNLAPNWEQDYPVKIYNNSAGTLVLSTNASYETVNDPESIRENIYVEPIEWADANNNGLVDAGELGTSYGKDTIIKWKTVGFALDQIESGEVRGFVLRFSTTTLPESKQGATGTFDFEFDSVGLDL